MQFPAPLREQLFRGKARLQRRVHDLQMSIVIQLYEIPVESDHNKAVLLLIIIEADADRRHQKRILFDILLLEEDLFHDLFTAQRDTLFDHIQLLCQRLTETVYLAASADDKRRRHSLVAI